MVPIIVMWARRDQDYVTDWTSFGFDKVDGNTLTLPSTADKFLMVNTSPNLVTAAGVVVYGLGGTLEFGYKADTQEKPGMKVEVVKPGGVGFTTLTMTKVGAI